MNESAKDPFGGDSFQDSGGTDITNKEQRLEWMTNALGGFVGGTVEERQTIMDQYWTDEREEFWEEFNEKLPAEHK